MAPEAFLWGGGLVPEECLPGRPERIRDAVPAVPGVVVEKETRSRSAEPTKGVGSMIVGKGALAAAAAVARVDDDPVVLRGDGAVVAVNRFVAFASGPLPAEARSRVPLTESTLGAPALYLEPDVVSGVARDITKDRRFGGLLEHADVRTADAGGDGRVEVEMTDGVRRRTQVLKRLPREGDASAVLRELFTGDAAGVAHAVLNRKRLRAALDALDAAAPDTTGEAPVWVEFSPVSGAVLLRVIDYRTGQRSAARIQSYRAEAGKWLERDAWESGHAGRKAIRKGGVAVI